MLTGTATHGIRISGGAADRLLYIPGAVVSAATQEVAAGAGAWVDRARGDVRCMHACMCRWRYLYGGA